ncbi:TBC1 domain family member 30-like [Stegostoma tigrinum]|uniref:TBC1 domain family member 30-like n=1 Tax=Stegostoma tigrinum TaxID=3053191 RepID=UPI0028704C9F|nr:TBC1 domain family member 30-like [Stegostoma tigrinum]XP_048409504.2 TBC1 domain family member 30-like [Stegostoma tigrinum]
MNQDQIPVVNLNSTRHTGRCLRKRNRSLGSVLSNVLQKRKCISRSAPRLLCTLESGADPRVKVNTECLAVQNEFQQWFETCRAIVWLPAGIPKQWRPRVWITLADHHLRSISIDWEKTKHFFLNEQRNPSEDALEIQIDKDLRQSSSNLYSGTDVEQFYSALKRLLLAYAHWNKRIGYCQGFIIPAAVILKVMERDEGDALKVLVYLLDRVLPDDYFTNNLSALTVDIAVFHDLLRIKLPELSQHLDHLCTATKKANDGRCILPLTSVVTMQWFLTLFTSCLPKDTILRVWDAILFEGSEVLFRVALALWAQLGEWIKKCQRPDEITKCLNQEMMEINLADCSKLMQSVYSMATFPFTQVVELREKHSPSSFQAKVAASSHLLKEAQCKGKASEVNHRTCTFISAVGYPGVHNPAHCQKTAQNEKRKGSCNLGKTVPATTGDSISHSQVVVNSTEYTATHTPVLKQHHSKMTKRQQQNQYLTPRHGNNESCSPGTPIHSKKSKGINRFLGGKKLKNSSKSNRVHHTPNPRVPQPIQKEQKNKITVPWCSQKRVPRNVLTRNLKVKSGCSDTVGLLEDQTDSSKAEVVKFDDLRITEANREGSQLHCEAKMYYSERLAIELCKKDVDNLARVENLFKTLQIGEPKHSLFAAESSNQLGVCDCCVDLRKDRFKAKNFTSLSAVKANITDNTQLADLSGNSLKTQNLGLRGSCSNVQILPFNK